jgi:hypothetical protein
MPNTLIFSLGVELALIIATTLLLIPPKAVFRVKLDRIRPGLRWGGIVFLCLTFCWSIVVGIVLSMNHLSFSL